MPILYLDHKRIPAPLNCSYRATDARHLTSIRSVVCEVDCTYCPQCFTYHDAYTATKSKGEWQGRCIRPHCKACPVCFIPLQVTIEPSSLQHHTDPQYLCVYKCGYCRYSSMECGIYAQLDCATSNNDGPNSAVAPDAAAKLAEELGKVYQKHIQDVDATSQNLFNSLVGAWNQKEQDCRRIQKLQSICDRGAILRSTATTSTVSKTPRTEDWRNRSTKLLSSYLSNVLVVDVESSSSHSVASSSSNSQQEEKNLWRVPNNFNNVMSMNSCVQQTVVLASATVPSQRLFPLRIPMFSKVTKRCPLELAKGKPGILVKTKMNPLEGDTTSSRTGHGQWWKKDCSAIHDVPRLELVKYGYLPSSCAAIYSFLLKIHNPMLCPIQIRLATRQQTSTDDPSVFENVLLDIYDANLNSETVHVMKIKNENDVTSSWVEMDAAQTLELLDLYTLSKNTAKDEEQLLKNTIHEWDSNQSIRSFLSSSAHEGQQHACEQALTDNVAFRVLGIDKDTAWLEWTVEVIPPKLSIATASTHHGVFDKPFYGAIPLSIQVIPSGLEKPFLKKPSEQQETIDDKLLTFDTLVVCKCMGDQ